MFYCANILLVFSLNISFCYRQIKLPHWSCFPQISKELRSQEYFPFFYREYNMLTIVPFLAKHIFIWLLRIFSFYIKKFLTRIFSFFCHVAFVSGLNLVSLDGICHKMLTAVFYWETIKRKIFRKKGGLFISLLLKKSTSA